MIRESVEIERDRSVAQTLAQPGAKRRERRVAPEQGLQAGALGVRVGGAEPLLAQDYVDRVRRDQLE